MNWGIISFHFIVTLICTCQCLSNLVELDSNRIEGTGRKQKPHIILMVADDAGWNDFSFHGSPQIPSPNIDAVALNGVILNGYYSAPLCTPSRGSTLTGKYAIHLALQHYVITGGQPKGLPLEEKLLPQYLKELGYATHLVGKWHLGHSRKVYTPTYRGYDSYFGYYLGMQDYYSHSSREQYGKGYDFRRNVSVDYDSFGKYNTDLFTNESVRLIENHPTHQPLFLMITHEAPHSAPDYDPLQAPQENVDKFEQTIPHINRRKYAGMVDKLDESMGKVVTALSRQKMLHNSIIILISDNGGPPEGFDHNHASNWPLRGTKNTLWEGGTRLAACLWSPLVQPHVREELFHSSDWLPTLLEAAQGDPESLGQIDGVSQWKSLIGIASAPLNGFLYNIDDLYNNSAVRYGKWKLIQGNTSASDIGGCPLSPTGPSCDRWFGPSGRDTCTPFEDPSNDTCPLSCVRRTVEDLIPLIVGSEAGQAFASSGFPLNIELAKEMQRQANLEFKCAQPGEIGCNAFEAPCLFNVEDDPCEKRNLAGREPEMVEFLSSLIHEYNLTAIPPLERWDDPNSAPKKWGYIWTYFLDLVSPSAE